MRILVCITLGEVSVELAFKIGAILLRIFSHHFFYVYGRRFE